MLIYGVCYMIIVLYHSSQFYKYSLWFPFPWFRTQWLEYNHDYKNKCQKYRGSFN